MGCLSSYKILIKNGGNINFVDSDTGETFLHFASYEYSTELVKFKRTKS